MIGRRARLTRRMARLVVVAATAIAVATTAACSSPGPASARTTVSPPATMVTPTATADPDASPWPTDATGRPVGWQLCGNTVNHYDIAYPAAWFTASLGPNDACARFDPATFTVIDGPRLDREQLWAYYQASTAAEFMDALWNPDFFTVISRTDVTVGGRPAIRYEVNCLPPRGPSGPTFPVGTHIYGYVIDGGGARSLDVATYAEPGDASYAHRRHIVDQAATTVHFS